MFASVFGEGPALFPMELPGYIGGEYDEIRLNGERVGCSTSRAYSPTLRKMISLGVAAKELLEPGTQVAVLWGPPGTSQNDIRCPVAALPLKEDKLRVDVSALE